MLLISITWPFARYGKLVSVTRLHNPFHCDNKQIETQKILIKTLMAVNTWLLIDVVNQKNWGFGETGFKIHSVMVYFIPCWYIMVVSLISELSWSEWRVWISYPCCLNQEIIFANTWIIWELLLVFIGIEYISRELSTNLHMIIYTL